MCWKQQKVQTENSSLFLSSSFWDGFGARCAFWCFAQEHCHLKSMEEYCQLATRCFSPCRYFEYFNLTLCKRKLMLVTVKSRYNELWRETENCLLHLEFVVPTDLKIGTWSSILLSLDSDVEANCFGLRLASQYGCQRNYIDLILCLQ